MGLNLTEFHWPSFAEVATALGGWGIMVPSKTELEAALTALDNRDRPLLIELKLDPHDVVGVWILGVQEHLYKLIDTEVERLHHQF